MTFDDMALAINEHPKPELFLDIINMYQNAKNIGELLELGRDNAKRLGFSRMTYHQLPAIGNYAGTGLSRYYAYNIPKDVRASYDAVYDKKFDPLIQHVLETGSPVWLSEAAALDVFRDNRHSKTIQRTMELLGDGLAIPLYGPKLKLGYLFLAFGDTPHTPSDFHKWVSFSTATVFHTRYCTLANDVAQKINLTLREMDVLELVVMGRTNPQIAAALGISKHTVNSYMKTLFLKFGTADRVSTVIKALTHDVVV